MQQCMLTISIEICPSQHNGVPLVNTTLPRMRPKVPMPSVCGSEEGDPDDGEGFFSGVSKS